MSGGRRQSHAGPRSGAYTAVWRSRPQLLMEHCTLDLRLLSRRPEMFVALNSLFFVLFRVLFVSAMMDGAHYFVLCDRMVTET